MVFQKEATSSLSWLGHLRQSLSTSSQSGDSQEFCLCDSKSHSDLNTASGRMELTKRAYEIAGDLESGAARELTGDLQHPLKRSLKLWKFKVTRSEDKLEYWMRSEAGDFLMYAKAFVASCKVLIYTYNPADREQASLFDRQRPAFTLSWNTAQSDWRLVAENCIHCHYAPRCLSCGDQGGRELARMSHFRRSIGDGIFSCMEIAAAPLRPDGCGPAPPPCVTGIELGPLRLCTREPMWNDEVDSLVLAFKGRNVIASAKNFQLVSAKQNDRVVCQYAKIGHNSFSLDLRHPMSAVLAFGISLSTLLWK